MKRPILARDKRCPGRPCRIQENRAQASLKRSLLLAAALVLLTATAAAVSRAGVLELFFQGDTSQLEPYVQTALDTAENQDYRLTVDSLPLRRAEPLRSSDCGDAQRSGHRGSHEQPGHRRGPPGVLG